MKLKNQWSFKMWWNSFFEIPISIIDANFLFNFNYGVAELEQRIKSIPYICASSVSILLHVKFANSNSHAEARGFRNWLAGVKVIIGIGDNFKGVPTLYICK